MYNIIRNVILSGRYELADLLKKIDTLWLQGDVTDAEKDELTSLAREHCTPDMGYQSLQQQIDALVKRVEALEQGGEEPGPAEEYPPWQQPTGAHDAYYTGDKMTYNGLRYVCIAPEGYAVTYPPDILPGMWELVPEVEPDVEQEVYE